MDEAEAARRQRFLTSISGTVPSPVLPKTRPEPDDDPAEIKPWVPEPGSLRQLQLVVCHRGIHTASYYSIPSSGWRIDLETRHIVLGKGLPRKYIPLDNVLSYDIEEVTP